MGKFAEFCRADLPPSARVSRKLQCPRSVPLKAIARQQGRDVKRLDIIRHTRPQTPASTVGDMLGDAHVELYSSFSPDGVFDANIYHLRSSQSPMERSQLEGDLQVAKRRRRLQKERDHEMAVEEYQRAAATPASEFRTRSIVSTVVRGSSRLERAVSAQPSSRASTPAGGLPPRPASRHTAVRIGTPDLFRKRSESNLGLSSDDSLLRHARRAASPSTTSSPIVAVGESVKPPVMAVRNRATTPSQIMRPASALSAVSNSESQFGNFVEYDMSNASRPTSASPYCPDVRKASVVRVNEVLRTSISARPGSAPIEVRPMRSFVQ